MLTQFAIITSTDDNVEGFLQGQLTCDMSEINETQSRLAAYCNHKGRVISVMRVVRWQGHIYLICPKTMVDITLTTLQKFAQFSKITFFDCSDRFNIIGINAGDEHKQMVLPTTIDHAIADDEKIIIRVHDSKPRFMTICNPNISDQVTKSRAILDDDSWHQRELDQLIVTMHPDISGKFTPHMLGLQRLNAISFNKGCYIGQEIVARTEHLGKNKREIKAITVNTTKDITISDKLTDNNNQYESIILDFYPIGKNKYKVLTVLPN